jgi:hypothetical protein
VPSRLRNLILVLLLGLVALPAGVFAQDATPPAGGTGEWSPRDTLNALLAAPFPVDLLPAGSPTPEISQWLEASGSDLEGTIGAAQMRFDPNTISGIYFLVYPSDDSALQHYGESAQAVAQSQGTPVPIAEVPASFYLDYDGYSVCITLDRNVVIIGGATNPGDGASTAQLACDYATAGQTHLNGIFDLQPQVVPAPQDPPTGLDILNQLIALPFPEKNLPANLSQPMISEWPYGDTDLDGAVGGATMSTAGDDTTGISWIVFPDQTAAEARFAQFASAMGTPTADGATPSSLQQVADGYALCAAVEGQVLVIGAYTVDEGGTTETAQERACQLMAAGQAHLGELFTESVATPAASPAVSPVASDAQRLLDALANTPFPTGMLPPAFTDPVVTPTLNVDDLFGVLGQVSVTVNSSDIVGISYLVYPSVDEANSWMQANALATGVPNGPLGGEDGRTWESYLNTFGNNTTCAAQDVNVIVIGIADARSGDAKAAACSLALAGLAHLQELRAQH